MATDGQQRRSTMVSGGRSPLTASQPLPYQYQRSGQRCHVACHHATLACRSNVSPRGSATSADWVLHAYMAATSAADVAEGILTL
ncbi:hypothetical protein Tco_0040786 [Tanacetum coccineum]